MLNKSSYNIQNLFNHISGYYDFMNNIISLGLHKLIKSECLRLLEIKEGFRVLDLCCGTGDILEIIEKKYKNVELYGLDFSEQMIKMAESKNINAEFVVSNAENIPYDDNSFDIVISSFGLRNVQDKQKVLAEIFRVLKKDGKFMHLDFGKKNIFNKIFNLYVPVVSLLFSKSLSAYSHLINSKKNFLEPDELIEVFKSKGFEFLQKKDFIFKSISMQIMQK